MISDLLLLFGAHSWCTDRENRGKETDSGPDDQRNQG